jgi:hypothetical protein
LPAIGLLIILAASIAGLLCARIHPYDDGILLVGARLVDAGWLPFRDFYTHYGPLGFGVQALFSGTIAEPGAALRVGQASCLAALAALAVAVARRSSGGPAALWVAAGVVLVLSPAALHASFYGFALAAAALGAFLLAEISAGRRAALVWSGIGGLSLGAAALTRPAFALYALVAILAVSVSSRIDRREGSRSVLPVLLAAFAASVAVLWLALYRPIPLAEAWDAMIRTPQRLMTSGTRYREAPFLRAPLPLAFVLSTLLAGLPLVWAAGLASRALRRLAAGGAVLAGAAPLWLRFSTRPARDIAVVSAVLLAVTAILAVVARRSLGHGILRGAALFGVAGAAFAHYFWSRPDLPHLVPFLALGATSALMALPFLKPAWRWGVLALLLVDFPVFFLTPGTILFPAEAAMRGGLSSVLERRRAQAAEGWRVWPCSDVPADAQAAAREADAGADPASRFVAVASSQATTDENPVILFLLSSRLPYTRWYQYDPGLQSSPEVQRQMTDELARSGSRTAVVWPADPFAGPPSSAAPPKTSFDAAFERLYPVTLGRAGRYEVRARAEP